MDVRRLELLRELADRGSVTAVAAATHRTPSAVSQQLKQLEREAGIPLTERSGRGIALTAAGRELAKTATAVATAIERAEALWQEYQGTPQGEVSLLVFPTAGRMLIPGMLRAIADTPGLRVICSDRDGSARSVVYSTPGGMYVSPYIVSRQSAPPTGQRVCSASSAVAPCPHWPK